MILKASCAPEPPAESYIVTTERTDVLTLQGLQRQNVQGLQVAGQVPGHPG